MKKMYLLNFKRLLSCVVALCVFTGFFAMLPEMTVQGENIDYADFKPEFLTGNGTFNIEADGFPKNYVFNFEKQPTVSTYCKAVPKEFFAAIKSSGKSAVIIDGIGVRYEFDSKDIAEIPASQYSTTVLVGSRYRNGASYATIAKKIAADNMGIAGSDYNMYTNFGFLELQTGGGIASNCKISCKMDFGEGKTDAAETFYNNAARKSVFIYQYSSNVLTDRTVEIAGTGEKPFIKFSKSESGSIQLLISDRRLKKNEVIESAPFSKDFVKDGKFVTEAVGFPSSYVFDFSLEPTVSTYCKAVTKEFFAAVKDSGETVVIIDGLGLRYSFDAKDIVDIDPANYSETVNVGARYRNTVSYSNVAKKIAFDNMGIADSDYNMYKNFGFLEIQTGGGITSNSIISVKMDFGEGKNDAAETFYNNAVNKTVYIYQYSSNALTEREVEMAKAEESPYISFSKSESGSIQLLFSDRALKGGTAVISAPYSESFVKDGKFVTTAPGFPSEYIFTFGSFSNALPGFDRQLFLAIKNSGKVVTLIDRTGISYQFDGSKMGNISAEMASGIFQLQSLYKTSTSYQTVMSKIAAESQILDGFEMNQDWIILDVQPETSVGRAVNNTLPENARISLRLNGGTTGPSNVADLFAQYAREGKLKAYYYNKENTVQDIYEDKEPIIPEVDADGNIIFYLSEPATLIFTEKDLLAGRLYDGDTNPYEMVLRKDGKVMSDGYTVEVGDTIYVDLFMNNGRIFKHNYTWEIVGPGKDCVSIKEAEDSRGLCYELKALRQSKSGEFFQIRVYADSNKNNYTSTGAITVTYSIYGENFYKDGKFITEAENFPGDYVFKMPSSKYMITGEFLNAAYNSGHDVTLVDSTGIQYIISKQSLKPVDKSQWGVKYPVKALYKDSESYQTVLKVVAYRNDHLKYELNTDYQIMDFQAHGIDLPFEVTGRFKLGSKANDEQLAQKYTDLMRSGNLYAYEYSKTKQDVSREITDLTVDSEGYLTMKLSEPITVVFSAKKLIADNSPDWLDDYNYDYYPATSDNSVAAAAALITILSAGVLAVCFRGTRKNKEGD